jgi:hypothetical protein
MLRALEKITASNLLNVIYEFGGFHQKKDFYNYFNEVRMTYYREIGEDRTFNTSRDQFWKWMKQGKGINSINFNRDMAVYILNDLYIRKSGI